MQRFNFLHFVGSSVGYMVLFIHQGPFIIYLFLRHQMLMPFSRWKSVDGWNVPSNKGSFSNLKLVIIMLVHVSSRSLRLFLMNNHVSFASSQYMFVREEDLWNKNCWYCGSRCMFGHMSCWALNLSAFITRNCFARSFPLSGLSTATAM